MLGEYKRLEATLTYSPVWDDENIYSICAWKLQSQLDNSNVMHT